MLERPLHVKGVVKTVEALLPRLPKEKEGPDEFPEEYAEPCKVNDIVTMMVDLVNNTLSYKVNDKDLGVAFEEIDIGKSWRVGVIFQKSGSKVQVFQH